MIYDKNYFIKQRFNSKELASYKSSAKNSLYIAQSSKENSVKFHFAYMALIKVGIYCLAREGYRIKSRMGHHQKIIESLSALLKDRDVVFVGDKMRKDRNLDLYSSSHLISLSEVREYLNFVEALYRKL